MYALINPGDFCRGFKTVAQPPLGCPEGEQPLQLCDRLAPTCIVSPGDCFRVLRPHEAPVVLEPVPCCTSSGALPLNHRTRL